MDIRLKNRNRWGTVLSVLVILSSVGGMMACFSWLRSQAIMNARPIGEALMEEYAFEGYYARIDGVNYDIQNFWQLNEMIFFLIVGIGCLVAAAAFLIGCLKKFGMAEKRLYAAPFEIVAAIGICGMGIWASECDMFIEIVWYTVLGELQENLRDELMLTASQADGIVIALHIFLWLIFFSVIYWVVTCLSVIFVIGPVRYFKERTLIGRFLRFCKRTFRKTYDLVESIDFREKPTRIICKVVLINFLLLTVITSFWFFGIFGLVVYSIVLFFLLRRSYDDMQQKYQALLRATNQIAEGNLDVRMDENLGIFEPLRGEIEKIQSGFKKAVEEEVKSQSMKTELITNVSHDLKTPLTAIITYVNLLKEEPTEEEQKGYIEVLDQKSMRLKALIEDLFEISKANSRNVSLNLVDVDVVSLLKQVRLELDDKISSSGVEFRWNLPDDKIVLRLDSEKTYRVFENLLVNITKYAMPGTRAYVDMEQGEAEVLVSMKNISATEISIAGDSLTERFVRGDASRNTEGSGLGLAIAKSFVELEKGKFAVETEADLFKVMIVWKKEENSEWEQAEAD